VNAILLLESFAKNTHYSNSLQEILKKQPNKLKLAVHKRNLLKLKSIVSPLDTNNYADQVKVLQLNER